MQPYRTSSQGCRHRRLRGQTCQILACSRTALPPRVAATVASEARPAKLLHTARRVHSLPEVARSHPAASGRQGQVLQLLGHPVAQGGVRKDLAENLHRQRLCRCSVGQQHRPGCRLVGLRVVAVELLGPPLCAAADSCQAEEAAEGTMQPCRQASQPASQPATYVAQMWHAEVLVSGWGCTIEHCVMEGTPWPGPIWVPRRLRLASLRLATHAALLLPVLRFCCLQPGERLAAGFAPRWLTVSSP
jgi:hypothetical protein